MDKLTGLDWVVVLVYMGAMIVIGLIASRKVSNFEDHILSGRSVPTLYLAPCLLTTQIGAGSLIGYVGLCYELGFSGGWWIYGNIITFICLALIGAKPLRKAIKANTLPEWFKLRYNESSRIFTAITTLIAEIAFTAGQVVGGGVLFSVVMGWSLSMSIIFFSVVVAVYTVLGGLWAVFLTDFIQMFVMILGLGAVVFIGLQMNGGFTGLQEVLPDGYFDFIRPGEVPTVVASVLYSIPAIFCSFDVIQKVMAAKSPKVAKNSCFWAAGGVVIFAICIPLIGMLGYAILGPNVSNPETISAELISTILPTGLKGLGVAAILATLMSSSSACIMAASSVLTNDLLPHVSSFNKMDSKQKMNMSMIFTFLLSVVCWALATFMESALTNMELAWTALSCGAFIPLIFGLLWKRTSSKAAITCMFAGSITGLVWVFLDNPMGLRPVIPAYVVGILVIVVLSFIFPDKYSEERQKDSGLAS